MKKRFFFVCIILLFIILVCGLYIYSKDNLKFMFEYEFYNNISFSNGKKIKVNIPVDNKVKYLSENELTYIFESDSAVVYFGYTTCPWCRNIVSPLVNVIKDNNIDKLYYVDVKNVDTSSIYSILEEYLETDDSGNKHLYVPDVYFIKDGKIVFHHLGAVESYKNGFKGMNEKQLEELKNIYQNGIDLMLGEEG